ncbi:MAG: hypothetical protein AAGD06_23165, partial [Acidobacteriota bacterium]
SEALGGHLSAVELTALGLPRIQIRGQSFVLDCCSHRGTGQVQISPSGTGLELGNLSSRTEDGLDVDLGAAESSSIFVSGLDPLLSPGGTALNVKVSGSIGGVDRQPVADVRVEDVGIEMTAAFEFYSAGGTYSVEVLEDGEVVGAISGISNGPAASFVADALTYVQELDPTRSPVTRLELPLGTRVTLGDLGPFFGDSLRAYPDSEASSQVDHLDALDLTADHPLGLTVSDPAITLFQRLNAPLEGPQVSLELCREECPEGHCFTAYLCFEDFNGDQNFTVTSPSNSVTGFYTTSPDPVRIDGKCHVAVRGGFAGKPNSPLDVKVTLGTLPAIILQAAVNILSLTPLNLLSCEEPCANDPNDRSVLCDADPWIYGANFESGDMCGWSKRGP